jgi:small subunit ribosomal protein S13
MVYLFESNIPENKSVYFGLTYIYGIGKSRSFLICKNLGFSLNLKIKHLSKDQLNNINKNIDLLNLELASNLKKIKLLNAKKLISIKSYRGLRRYQGLPVRGQRTHTNAKTSRKKMN